MEASTCYLTRQKECVKLNLCKGICSKNNPLVVLDRSEKKKTFNGLRHEISGMYLNVNLGIVHRWHIDGPWILIQLRYDETLELKRKADVLDPGASLRLVWEGG